MRSWIMSASSPVSDAVQVEEVVHDPGARTRAIAAHFANFGAKLSRLELDIALGRRGRGGASVRRVSVLAGDAPMPTSPPMSPTRSAAPRAPNCSRRSRAARRAGRLSGQGDGGARRRRLRQPPDRQGAAAGRRAPKPISSPNWKSSPTTSNAPMARRWATWTRIRCSICAPAAFPKTRRAASSDPRLSGRCAWPISPAPICAKRCAARSTRALDAVTA